MNASDGCRQEFTNHVKCSQTRFEDLMAKMKEAAQEGPLLVHCPWLQLMIQTFLIEFNSCLDICICVCQFAFLCKGNGGQHPPAMAAGFALWAGGYAKVLQRWGAMKSCLSAIKILLVWKPTLIAVVSG